jgi:hypothetical protein
MWEVGNKYVYWLEREREEDRDSKHQYAVVVEDEDGVDEKRGNNDYREICNCMRVLY